MLQDNRMSSMLLVMAAAVACFAGATVGVTVTGSSAELPLNATCRDGSTPLNSASRRCDAGPSLAWAGRKCSNSSANHLCPVGFTCTAAGSCCGNGQNLFWTDLCSARARRRLGGALRQGGSCSKDDDCKGGYRSLAHQCCGGKCFMYMPQCLIMQREYRNLQSSGKMPRQHLPICKADGSFQRVQSDPRFGIKWCVNETTGLAIRDGSACCPAQAKKQICPTGQKVHACARDMCSLHVCEAQPAAVCRVNPCGGCKVEFVDKNGKVVNCSLGISGCAAKSQMFFTELARMHRWDQLHPEQHASHVDSGVSTSANAEPHVEFCSKQLCVKYNRSLLEPERSVTYGTSGRLTCPASDSAGHRCVRSCPRWSGCSDTSKRCCRVGCGFECVKLIGSRMSCNVTISSGRCPKSGCHSLCKRWGWDNSRGTCRPFWYAGAGGNNNRYKSWSDCMWYAHKCHKDVLIALPWRPYCRVRRTQYDSTQQSDNGFYWCADANGKPTSGSLHATYISCTPSGQLIRDSIYRREEQQYIAKCPGNKKPKFCHNTQVPPSCQSPGVYTFADACNDCKLVHINENGERVQCRPASAACSASASAAACKSPAPRFVYHADTKKCERAPAGKYSCTGKGDLGDHVTFSREEYCLHACSSQWCPGISQPKLYPDLCVNHTCSKAGAVCVADDCTGMEKYFFLENGTEVTECRRQTQPLDLASAITCKSMTVPTPATKPSAPPSTKRDRLTTPSKKSSPSKTPMPSTKPSTSPSPRTRRPRPGPIRTRSPEPTEAAEAAKLTSLCRLRALLLIGAARPRCDEKGQYLPKQCGASSCYCVVVDSGKRIESVQEVPLASAGSLTCPRQETTSVSISLRFDGDFNSLLPDAAAQQAFKEASRTQLSKVAQLPERQVQISGLRSGSIVVDLQLSKASGDTADLPAAEFELKSQAQRRSLSISFNGRQLRAAESQNFASSRGSSTEQQQQKQPQPEAAAATGGGGGSGAVIGGVVGAIVAVAAAAFVVLFMLRRRRLQQSGTDASSQMYETMSNASSAAGVIRDSANFENGVYANGAEDVYDNFDSMPTPSSTA